MCTSFTSNSLYKSPQMFVHSTADEEYPLGLIQQADSLFLRQIFFQDASQHHMNKRFNAKIYKYIFLKHHDEF